MSVSVLFVCLGNICRSPTAEAVFRQYVERDLGAAHPVRIDSAGTGDWHIGSAPDPRSRKVGRTRGYDLEPLRARQVQRSDFDHFDYILAMDHQNLLDLKRIAPENYAGQLKLFLDFAPDLPDEVPDPYFGDDDSGFHHVIDLIEAASDGLLRELKARR